MNVFLFMDDLKALRDNGMLLLAVPAALDNKRALLSWYAKKLHFPSYFGGNWDAFGDCLRDLSWVAAGDIVIMHSDLPLMGSPADQTIYLATLADAVRSWEGHGGQGHGGRGFTVAFPSWTKDLVSARQ